MPLQPFKAHAMINHKAVAKDILTVCKTHKLTGDEAAKCLIYTATKLIAEELKCSDTEAAQVLSGAALRFKAMISQCGRMFENKG